jgi:SAM-dependent methyltransferase
VERREPWLLDELAFAGRENLDPAHVAAYNDKEDAGALAEVHLLRERGALTPDATVIDLGAGTGQFTLAASPHCWQVIAVDVSPLMLDQLEASVRERGINNVRGVLAGFLTYEHDRPPADLIYSRYALHHLPDFWKAVALRRMAGMLRPGGTLRLWDIVYNFTPQESHARLTAWMDEFPETSASGGWIRADVAEHIRDEHSTFTWLLEPMLQQAGLRIEDACYSGSGVFAQYLCTRA